MNWKRIYRHSFSLQKPPSRYFIFATSKLSNYLVQVFLLRFSSFILSDYTSLAITWLLDTNLQNKTQFVGFYARTYKIKHIKHTTDGSLLLRGRKKNQDRYIVSKSLFGSETLPNNEWTRGGDGGFEGWNKNVLGGRKYNN